MSYSIGDRLQEMSKEYERSAKVFDKMDRQLNDMMFDDKDYRARFSFEGANGQEPGRLYNTYVVVILDLKSKDDHYGTQEFDKCACAKLYVSVESLDNKATLRVTQFEVTQYQWLKREYLNKFIDLIDDIAKIEIAVK